MIHRKRNTFKEKANEKRASWNRSQTILGQGSIKLWKSSIPVKLAHKLGRNMFWKFTFILIGFRSYWENNNNNKKNSRFLLMGDTTWVYIFIIRMDFCGGNGQEFTGTTLSLSRFLFLFFRSLFSEEVVFVWTVEMWLRLGRQTVALFCALRLVFFWVLQFLLPVSR